MRLHSPAITGSITLSGSIQGNLNLGAVGASSAMKIYAATNGNPLLIYEDTDNSLLFNFYLDSSDNAGLALYANGQSQKVNIGTDANSPTYFTGGSVGIGTSSPDLRLTVQGSSGNIANFTNGSTDFVIYQDNSNSQIANSTSLVQQKLNMSIAERQFEFYNAGTEAAVITGSGESTVLVINPGSAHPGVGNNQHGLYVHKDLGDARVSIDASASGDAQLRFLNAGSLKHFIYSDGSATNDPLIFYDNTATAVVMSINNGNVGIGTASPDSPLHVHKASAGTIDANANAVLTLEDDGTNVLQFLSPNDQEQQIRFGDVNDDGAGFIAYAHATNKMSFGTAGPTKMTILSSGNVGIGTTSPAHKLDVVGDVRVRGDLTAETLIISSSVTNLTTQFASGSTRFGDTQDDLHEFTGSLRISGSSIHLNDAKNNIILGTTSSPAGDAITTGTFNILLGGNNAGGAINSGAQNVGIGGSALEQVTTGDGNIAIGYNSGQGNTGADHNISIGTGAGDLTGPGNVAVGKGTLSGNNSGEYNVAIGFDAGNDVTTGQDNVLIGKNAGDSITIGRYNVALGSQALNTDDVGNSSVAIGYAALSSQNSDSNNEVTNNVGVGVSAGFYNVTGQANTYIGNQSGQGASGYSNSNNVGIGYRSLFSNRTGTENVAIGKESMRDATTSDGTVAVGVETLYELTTGDNNVGVGKQALYSVTSGAQNVAVGFKALRDNTASNNIAIGTSALENNTTGIQNVAIGYEALLTATELDSNIAIGYEALKSMSGSAGDTGNVAIGHTSGKEMTTDKHNTFIGRTAGAQTTNGSIENTFVGYFAGYTNKSGSSNTFIGAHSGYSFQNASLPRNTYVGAYSGYHNRLGSLNVYLGYSAGYGSSGNSHTGNVGVGYQALKVVSTGGFNVAVGQSAGDGVTTGGSNILLGSLAGDGISDASHIVAIGDSAARLGTVTTDANGSVAVGSFSLGNLTSGIGNVAVGFEALQEENDGDYNTAIGYQALTDQTGTSGEAANTAIGYKAGNSVTTGKKNIFIGRSAGASTTDVDFAIGIGWAALNGVLTSAADGTVCIGNASGNSITSAPRNTGVGDGTFQRITSTGGDSIAIGFNALNGTAAGTCEKNVAIGVYSMNVNQTHVTNNTGVGYQSLRYLAGSTSNYNSAFGADAGMSITAGSYNTAIGAGVLGEASGNAITGDFNTGVGSNALYNAQGTANANTAVGYRAGFNTTTASGSTSIGFQAGDAITTASGSVFVGVDAGGNVSTGNMNIAVGNNAMNASVTGDNNIAIGADAGDALTSGFSNIAIGKNAGTALTTAQYNILIGDGAGAGLVGVGNNVAIGQSALGLATTDSDQCVAIGNGAMGGNFSTANLNFNVAIGAGSQAGVLTADAAGTVSVGYQALNALTSGNGNTAIGYQALTTNVDGDRNTAVGYGALASHEADTDGHGENTSVGYQAGGDVSSGTGNTLIGSRAGNQGTDDITTGDNNTLIGKEARASGAGGNNQTVIGASAVGVGDNSVTLGNSDVTDIAIPAAGIIRAQSQPSMADDATLNIITSQAGAAMVHVYDSSSGGGGVFFCTYSDAAVKVAGSSNTAATDSDGNLCVFKSTSSHTVTVKNRLGGTKNIAITVMSALAT